MIFLLLVPGSVLLMAPSYTAVPWTEHYLAAEGPSGYGITRKAQAVPWTEHYLAGESGAGAGLTIGPSTSTTCARSSAGSRRPLSNLLVAMLDKLCIPTDPRMTRVTGVDVELVNTAGLLSMKTIQ